MQPPKERIKVETCDVCGDHGFTETIVTCSKCKVNCEHGYCMQSYARIIPKDWICEPCQSKGGSNSLRKANHDMGSRDFKKRQAVTTGKVKFLHEDEVIRLSSGKPSVGTKKVISRIWKASLTPNSNPPISSSQVFRKLPRNDEVNKKPMTNQHASFSSSKGPAKECIVENQQPLGGVKHDKKVQAHDDLQKENPTEEAPLDALSARKSSPIVVSGGIVVADAECNQSNTEKCDIKSIQENLVLNPHRKFLPCSIPAWRGQFQILQTAASSEFYDGFEAQPPCIVNWKAYKFSREMPSILQLESLPALNVLTGIFQDDSPKLQDIALYFFPSEHTDNSSKNLNSILNFMNAEKSMLRSYIAGVELLVFTANQLDMDSRGVIAAANAGLFLWGIFRKTKIDKDIKRVPDMEATDMDIRVIGGKDVVERVDHVQKDKPKSVHLMENYNKLDVPPGFEAFTKMS